MSCSLSLLNGVGLCKGVSCLVLVLGSPVSQLLVTPGLAGALRCFCPDSFFTQVMAKFGVAYMAAKLAAALL